jgi:hypothetical protein
MNVAELRAALEGLPDDLELNLDDYDFIPEPEPMFYGVIDPEYAAELEAEKVAWQQRIERVANECGFATPNTSGDILSAG